jgi:hypothetical protein
MLQSLFVRLCSIFNRESCILKFSNCKDVFVQRHFAMSDMYQMRHHVTASH